MLSGIAAMSVIFSAVCGCAGSGRNAMIGLALREAGDNAAELQRVLDHYDDAGRRGAAEYLVASAVGRGSRTGRGMDSIEVLYRELPRNGSWALDSMQMLRGTRFASMPLTLTRDVDALTAEYLCANIDDAWQMRLSRRWNSDLPDEIFFGMLLPYRMGDEPLTLWRPAYRGWLSDLEDSLSHCAGSVEAARMIAARIGWCPYNDRLSTPHRSALDLLEAPVGYCREDCDRTVYAMRSMGVPVAVDRMLVSPDNGGSHSWTVVWDNIDRRTRMFDTKEYLPTRDSIHYDQRRKGKVYRSVSEPDHGRLARYRHAVNPPAMLLNPLLSDVTAEYFGHNSAEVDLWSGAGDAVYLGVFSGQRFQPVDIGGTDGSRAVFSDIEPDLIYAPVAADGQICGYPFMLRSDTGRVHSFIPDGERSEAVTLTRKMPVRFLLRHWMQSVVGVHVQSAPSAGGPWTDLEVIGSRPGHAYRRIDLSRPLTGRYLRLIKPDGAQALIGMLLACRDTLGLDRLPVSVAGDQEAANRYGRITRDFMSFGLDPGADDCIVHIDSPDDVAALFLVTATDDNFVVPAEEYELLYFAGREGWKSAGRKISDGFSISFEAPAGALLWLRNLTKGREEQIFIWSGGRQLFNTDLYRSPR